VEFCVLSCQGKGSGFVFNKLSLSIPPPIHFLGLTLISRREAILVEEFGTCGLAYMMILGYNQDCPSYSRNKGGAKGVMYALLTVLVGSMR
jgi:hypothetical protein